MWKELQEEQAKREANKAQDSKEKQLCVLSKEMQAEQAEHEQDTDQ